MLERLLKLFVEKPPKIDHSDLTGLERMNKMRRKTDEIAKLHDVINDEDQSQSDGELRRDFLTKAREFEIGNSWKECTFREKHEKDGKTARMIPDWQDRVRHLPGFDADPQY